MKTFLKFLLPIALLSLLASCATFDNTLVNKVSKAAVHSILISRQVDTSDFPLVALIVKEYAKDKMDLTPILNKVQKDMYSVYAKHLPFALLPESELLANEDYKTVLSTETSALTPWYIFPEGYAKTPLSKKNAAAMNKAFPNTNAYVGMEISYALKKQASISIFSRAGIRATVLFTVINEKGEKILEKPILAVSKTTIGVILGGFNATPIQSMCTEATENAMAEFDKWILKELAKN